MKRNQKGFSAVEVLAVIAILGLIGFASWLVWQRHQDKTKSTTSSATVNQTKVADKPVPPVEKKTYTDAFGHFSVQYPENWQVKTESSSDKDAPYTRTTLTSPAGTVLNLNSDWGGKGGDCQPDDSDKPFKAGNQCGTVEYLTSDTLPIQNLYYSQSSSGLNGEVNFTYKPVKVALITKHFGDPKGKASYTIGVTDLSPNWPPELHKPTMGLVVDYEQITVYDAKGKLHPYIYAYSVSDSEAFLTSKEGESVKEILRTLKVDI